jgi:predicted nucleic acid-binding Zn ribbon protein
MNVRKCQKCGEALSADEETFCINCAETNENEQRESNDDKRRWKEREEKSLW